MSPRIALAGGVLLVAIVIGVVALLAGGSEGDADKPAPTVRAQLKLERGTVPETGGTELIVSQPQARLNTLETSGGATTVLLRCVDKQGAEAVRQKHPWPLQEEVGFSPHVHQPIRPEVLNALRECRMTGKGIHFTARVQGRVPAFQ